MSTWIHYTGESKAFLSLNPMDFWPRWVENINVHINKLKSDPSQSKAAWQTVVLQLLTVGCPSSPSLFLPFDWQLWTLDGGGRGLSGSGAAAAGERWSFYFGLRLTTVHFRLFVFEKFTQVCHSASIFSHIYFISFFCLVLYFILQQWDKRIHVVLLGTMMAGVTQLWDAWNEKFPTF